MKTSNLPRDPVLAVFAFLDTLLSDRERSEFAETPDGIFVIDSRRRRLADIVGAHFRLISTESCLRARLEEFELYHRDDITDALAAAYVLHINGEDPITALTANYTPEGYVLSWSSIEQLGARPLVPSFERLRPYWRDGDRLAEYSNACSRGFIAFRGMRRTWESETLHVCVPDGDMAWMEAKREFDALGGVKGFLAGRFEWPSLKPV